MKRKFILGSLIALSIFSIGCESNINLTNKEVILIDEETKETTQENNKLELNLLYRTSIENKFDLQSKTHKSYFLKDNIFEFTLKPIYTTDGHIIERMEIVNARIGKIASTKNEEGFNNIKWEESKLKGDLINSLVSGNLFGIRDNGIIYDVSENGELTEVKSYESIDKEVIDKMQFYNNIYNQNTEIVYLDRFNELEIIDEDNNKFKIENIEDLEIISEYDFKILGVEEERIYVSNKILNGYDRAKFILGYIENNKFYNLFEEEKLVIENEYSVNLYDNQAILSNNKILFSGIINDVNGIWNYDTKNKSLSIEMEFEKKVIASIYLSPNKENIIITTSKVEDGTIKLSDYIAKVDKDLNIKEISNLFYNVDMYAEEYKDVMVFDGFSENNKHVYYKGYRNNGDMIIYEVYEIKN